MMLSLLPAIAIPTLLGALVLAVLLREDRETGLLERLAFSYPLGVGLLTMQIFLLGLFRVPLILAYTAGVPMIEIAALSVWAWRAKVALFPPLAFGLVREITSPESSPLKKAALAFLWGWIAVKTGSVFLEASLRPIYAWDVWANWSVAPKLFYQAKSLLLDAPPEDFFGRGPLSRFLPYPLNNHLQQLWISLWNGGFDEVLVKLSSPFYLLSMAVVLYSMMHREIGRLAALGLLAVFLSSPLLSYHAIELYSDMPVSVYYLCALVAFLYAMRGRQAYWPLVGLFAAQALFTKDEALFFVLPLLLSAVTLVWRKYAGREKNAVLLKILLPLIYILPWYAFKITHSLGIGAESAQSDYTFVAHPETIIMIIRHITSMDNFGIFLVAFPVFMIAAGRPRKEFLYLFLPLVCYALFFTLLYTFTSYYFGFFSNGTVFWRNVLTGYPSLCLLTALLMKQMQETVRVPQP